MELRMAGISVHLKRGTQAYEWVISFCNLQLKQDFPEIFDGANSMVLHFSSGITAFF